MPPSPAGLTEPSTWKQNKNLAVLHVFYSHMHRSVPSTAYLAALAFYAEGAIEMKLNHYMAMVNQRFQAIMQETEVQLSSF